MKYQKHSKVYHLFDYLKHPVRIIGNVRWHIQGFKASQRFIFIVGAPRSGTTLLQKIISNNEDVKSFQEETEVFSKKNLFNYDRYKEFLSKDNFLEAIDRSESNSEFLYWIHKLQLGESKIYLEKTPQHAFYVDRMIDTFPNCNVIHISRDPRDAFCSGSSAKNIPQASRAEKYFRYWNNCIESVLSVEAEENYIHVKYEDLVRSPEKVVQGLCQSLKLDFSKDLFLANNDKRGALDKFKKLNKPIDGASVGQWRKILTVKENLKCFEICKAHMEKLGYDML